MPSIGSLGARFSLFTNLDLEQGDEQDPAMMLAAHRVPFGPVTSYITPCPRSNLVVKIVFELNFKQMCASASPDNYTGLGSWNFESGSGQA